jgi:glycosyltransferase involved in cell wall biosynthesis
VSKATVLIPTFDHGETLLHAVRSALHQTITEIEVFIVGDGVPPLTRHFIQELIAEDPRVRFFDNDKGPRHGEVHRAVALQEASGEIVCYLADDDLWLPEHLESMLELLEDADFANSLPLRVEPDGSLAGWAVNLAEESDRQLLLGGENRIPLSCSGHTLEAYRRLPYGWQTTPDDVPTDLYMFQQFLAADWLRAVSGSRPTCLHFPSPDRLDWTSEHRCAELEQWQCRIADEIWLRGEFQARVVEVEARGWAERDADARSLRQEREIFERRLVDTNEQLRGQKQRLDRTMDEVVRLRSELEDVEARSEMEGSHLNDLETALGDARRELEWMSTSLTWRVRGWLLSLPIVGGLLRWAVGARARRRGR